MTVVVFFLGGKIHNFLDLLTANTSAIHKLNKFIDIFLNITGIILTKPANLVGETHSERVLLGMCLLYALIMTGAFQVTSSTPKTFQLA